MLFLSGKNIEKEKQSCYNNIQLNERGMYMKLIPEQVLLLEKELGELLDKRNILREQKEYTNSHVSVDGESSCYTYDEREAIQKCSDRIRMVESLLRLCDHISSPNSDIITYGSHFSVEINYSEDESEVFNGFLVEEMVTTEDPNLFFSTKSYLGKALLGKQENDSISWQLPNGEVISGTVLGVEKHVEKIKK